MNNLSIQSKTIQADISPSNNNNSFTHIRDVPRKEIQFPNTNQDFGFTHQSKTIDIEIPQEEIWKTHDTYPGYVFSSFGRVYSYRLNRFLNGTKTNGKYINIELLDFTNESVRPYLSRIIYSLFGDDPDSLPSKQVDHIRNKQTLNNNINNLRLATSKENNNNKGKKQRNHQGEKPSSPYIGISKTKSNKWQASIKVNYKSFRLGIYELPENGSYVYASVASRFRPSKYWKNPLPNNF